MSALTRPRMTLAEFLDWEEQQEGRFEFDGRAPEAMVGGTEQHSSIQIAVCALLRDALRGSAFRVFNSDLKIEVAGSIRYPDAFVAPGPVRENGTVRRDPVVIFKVLSDSTSRKDRTVKNAEYRSTRSVRRYVMLEQKNVAATVFEHVGEAWVEHRLTGRGAVVQMPEIAARLTLGEIYEDLTGEDGDVAI